MKLLKLFLKLVEIIWIEQSLKLEKLIKNLSQYSDIKVYENINQELEKIVDAKN